MRSPTVRDDGYGAKAIAILRYAELPPVRYRAAMSQALVHLFSEKSIQRKHDEMVKRGYLHPAVGNDWRKASLTDKGRQTLETVTKIG
jgi:hypothetical protein